VRRSGHATVSPLRIHGQGPVSRWVRSATKYQIARTHLIAAEMVTDASLSSAGAAAEAQGCDGLDRQRPIAEKPLRRFLRFTVAADFEIRIGTAVWVPGTCRPPPLHGQAPRLTRMGAQCNRTQCNRTHAPSSLQNIRLSSAAANPLNGSRNSWADGDGSSVCTLIRLVAPRRAQGCNGFHASA
jgi:hypothetical protein